MNWREGLTITKPKHCTNSCDEMYKLKIFITKITHVRTFRWLFFCGRSVRHSKLNYSMGKSSKVLIAIFIWYRLCVACCCYCRTKWWKKHCRESCRSACAMNKLVSFFILKLNNIYIGTTYNTYEYSKSMLGVYVRYWFGWACCQQTQVQ